MSLHTSSVAYRRKRAELNSHGDRGEDQGTNSPVSLPIDFRMYGERLLLVLRMAHGIRVGHHSNGDENTHGSQRFPAQSLLCCPVMSGTVQTKSELPSNTYK